MERNLRTNEIKSRIRNRIRKSKTQKKKKNPQISQRRNKSSRMKINFRENR
jgi:hypothetical protein